jgi:hypothetical protein
VLVLSTPHTAVRLLSGTRSPVDFCFVRTEAAAKTTSMEAKLYTWKYKTRKSKNKLASTNSKNIIF